MAGLGRAAAAASVARGGDEAMIVMAFALGGVTLAISAVMVGVYRVLR